MKKALIVTHVSGFVPQFEMNNVRILQQMGYEVHYASNFNNVSYGEDNYRLDGTGIIRHQVNFVRSPFEFKTNVEAYQQLKEVLKKEEFALLHCHTPVAAVLARLAANPYRKKNLKVVYTAHGFHFYKGSPWKYWCLFYPIERWLAGMTDVLITINREDYERAKKFCNRKKTKVEHLSGVGVDIAYWSGKDLALGEREKIRNEIRKELGIQKEEIALLSVGELIPRKNHQAVIRALAKEKEKQNISFRYFICGQGVLKEELQKLIDTLGLSKEVTLLGYRKDIRALLYAMDCFVFPSKQEGMPMALMEAIAAGIPVKATNIRGNKDVLEDCANGIGLPEQYDIHQIGKKMKQIYEGLNETE